MRKFMAGAVSAVAVVAAVAACSTTTSLTATTAKAQCAPWRAISYASKHDTADTVREVRVHNLTGQKLGCWK